MQDLNDKVTGGVLTAVEWNEVPSEIQNIIEGLGITLSSGDLNQLGKAIAGYVANGNFYTDSGIADAYVLSVIGLKQRAPAYTNGFKISFIAGNSNVGASTVNIAGLGVKSLKTVGGGVVPSNYIVAGELTVATFDGTDFILSNPLSNVILPFDTLAAADVSPLLSVGQPLILKERSTQKGGGSTLDTVLASTVTPNGIWIIQFNGVPAPAQALAGVIRDDGGKITTEQLGFTADNATDETATINTVTSSGAFDELIIGPGVLYDRRSLVVNNTKITENGKAVLDFSGSSKWRQQASVIDFLRIGHRGLSAYFPEHTATAYQNAINYGLADAIEIDIQTSSDGVLFCIHDTTLDRTTNGTGLVSASTAAAIDALDAGSFFAAGYAGSRPIRLREAYSLLQGIGCKSVWPQANANVLATESERLTRFQGIIDAAREFYMEDVTFIQEFNVDLGLGDELRTISKNVKIAALFGGTVPLFNANLAFAVKDGNTVLLTEFQFLIDNPLLVEEAKQKGVDVAAFTVNDGEKSDELRKIGVVMQMTDINLRGAQ